MPGHPDEMTPISQSKHSTCIPQNKKPNYHHAPAQRHIKKVRLPAVFGTIFGILCDSQVANLEISQQYYSKY